VPAPVVEGLDLLKIAPGHYLAAREEDHAVALPIVRVVQSERGPFDATPIIQDLGVQQGEVAPDLGGEPAADREVIGLGGRERYSAGGTWNKAARPSEAVTGLGAPGQASPKVRIDNRKWS
jgi:hypothetical protein